MVLQELTVKHGFGTPEYNLIHAVQGTHENEFRYQVLVRNVVGVGDGRSKKEAKHKAASKVLELLAEDQIFHTDNNDVSARDFSQESPSKPLNCIPKLIELCTEFKVPIPEFTEISAVGPPHCREFTYDCHISTVVTRATAGSKKHARQLAAKEMLDK